MVFSNEPNQYQPEIPVITDYGFNVYFQNFRGIITGKDVPPDRVKALNDALNKTFASDTFQKFCAKKSSCTKPRTSKESSEFLSFFFDNLRKQSK